MKQQQKKIIAIKIVSRMYEIYNVGPYRSKLSRTSTIFYTIKTMCMNIIAYVYFYRLLFKLEHFSSSPPSLYHTPPFLSSSSLPVLSRPPFLYTLSSFPTTPCLPTSSFLLFFFFPSSSFFLSTPTFLARLLPVKPLLSFLFIPILFIPPFILSDHSIPSYPSFPPYTSISSYPPFPSFLPTTLFIPIPPIRLFHHTPLFPPI